MAIPIVGNAGFVVGADISLEMVTSARARLDDPLYWPVNADGQALPFKDDAFDAVVCQLGLQFFPNPAAGLSEFRRVVRAGGMVAVCVIATSDRLPMWGNLADAMDRFLHSSSATYSRCHGPSPIQGGWRGCSAMRASKTSVWNRSGVKALSIALMTIGRRSKKGLGNPEAYDALDEADRRSVREEVHARLAQYRSADGKLTMGVEMLIGSGRA